MHSRLHLLACVCSLQYALDTSARHRRTVHAHLDACGLQLSCHVISGLCAASSQRHICTGCGQAARGLLAQPRVATCITGAHSGPCCAIAGGTLSKVCGCIPCPHDVHTSCSKGQSSVLLQSAPVPSSTLQCYCCMRLHAMRFSRLRLSHVLHMMAMDSHPPVTTATLPVRSTPCSTSSPVDLPSKLRAMAAWSQARDKNHQCPATTARR